MVLHKKFLMLYLAGVDVEYFCFSRKKWYIFCSEINSLELFNDDRFEFRISPNQPQELIDDIS